MSLLANAMGYQVCCGFRETGGPIIIKLLQQRGSFGLTVGILIRNEVSIVT